VANVFLETLFYDVKLQYAVPIINQKGEVGYHCLSQQTAQGTVRGTDRTLVVNIFVLNQS
jgi:hypothetical protein